MIEFLVALTIGLFIVAGILEIYLSSLQIYRVQDETSRLQDSGRFAIELLSRYMRMAGYRTDPSMLNRDTFPDDKGIYGSDNFNYSFGPGQVVNGADVIDKGQSIDRITLRYQGGANKVVGDCLGNSVNNGQIAVVTFYLSGDESENGRLLRCRTIILRQVLNNLTFISKEEEDLIDGVESMEVRYGIDTAADSHAAVKAYVNASDLAGKSELWNNVVSVQIALLVRTDNRILSQKQTYEYPPWSNLTKNADDYRLRRVFTTNVNLRNRTP